MVDRYFIPKNEFSRIDTLELPFEKKLSLISDMCRINTLTAVKTAGSGHLGSSLSAMEIVVYLYYHEMNTIGLGIDHPDRDIYFSSKGHDVPGFYAVLHSLGIIPEEKLLMLRRLGGLDGHPDISIPGIECNTGSLGMGISKAKGMALAKKMSGHKGRVFVLTGDGELQEGQIYEALQSAAFQNINNIIAIVDHNKVQSDKRVDDILDLGDLESKLRAFGWFVHRCDGNDFNELNRAIKLVDEVHDQPKILIADTIKGKGVSFMEHPKALADGNGLYRWHSGAPDDISYDSAVQQIVQGLNEKTQLHELESIKVNKLEPIVKVPSGVTHEYVAEAYGKTLVEIGKRRKDVVVLDADLSVDCRTREFENLLPNQFVENGIAEQDMVSMAGGLALQGYLPIVNSFAAFLASRANEQIYTNAGENTKIVYVCHYAGLIPAGPGKSHQSVRDISMLGAIPNFEVIQPCNALETRAALKYCVEQTNNNCALRLIIGPSPQIIKLPENYRFEPGKGAVLSDGDDAVIFSYGPVMLNEALIAQKILKGNGISLKVVNMPWLNQVDQEWFKMIIHDISKIYFLEDHSAYGGLGEYLINHMTTNSLIKDKRVKIFAVDGFPACGTPSETLNHHKLNGQSIADVISD